MENKEVRDPQLNLENIRNVLLRQEETIIFALIERAQYCVNAKIYDQKAFSLPDFSGSLCDFYLYKTECVDAMIRRYTSPDQHSFFTNLPEPVIPVERIESPIMESFININDQIKEIYINKIVPYICESGDDGQYGSGANSDIHCLNALSRRIHYGKFVAESKYLNQPDEYRALVADLDIDGIMQLLTDAEVERRILERIERKAATYGQDPGDITKPYKIEPRHVVEIYRDWIIPLTKKVEVDYLLLRAK